MAAAHTSKSRSSRVLPAAVLLLAAHWSLQRAFVPQSHQLRRPAVGLRAQGGLVVSRDPVRIKELLLDSPNKALVTALEQTQEQVPQVASLQELQGTWELRGPKASSVRGLASGDLPKAILGLYQGGLGKLLNMELLSPPRVTISASGDTETSTRLRWGLQRDELVLKSSLSLRADNTLYQESKSTRSTSLKMNFPTVVPPRELKVTYFDGNTLILRDSSGTADVLVRRRQTPNQESAQSRGDLAPPAEDSEDKEEDEEPLQIPRQVEAGSQADQLLAEVERLRQQLQTDREVSKQQQDERARLQGEVQRLDKVVAEAAVKAQADSVKLSVMKELKAKVKESTKNQQQKSSEKEHMRMELAAEVTALEGEVVELEGRFARDEAREESLRQQISALEKGLVNGPREEWPGYRAALSKAREELKAVRAELRNTKSVVSRVRRALEKKQQQASKVAPVVEAEAAARQRLEAQLEAQRLELEEHRGSLSEKEAAEQALRAELEATKDQLELLEAKEQEGKERAAQVEREIGEVVAQVDEAQKAAKGLGTETKKKKIWGFFR